MKLSLSAVIATVFLLIAVAAANLDDAGFGSQYGWTSLDDALKKAKENEKPTMLIIYRDGCGACKSLKPKVAASTEMLVLSQSFNMALAGDNSEPSSADFSIDGKYVPRTYFVSPDESVMKEIINEKGNPSYKYYYPTTDELIVSMRKVIGLSKTSDKEL